VTDKFFGDMHRSAAVRERDERDNYGLFRHRGAFAERETESRNAKPANVSRSAVIVLFPRHR